MDFYGRNTEAGLSQGGEVDGDLEIKGDLEANDATFENITVTETATIQTLITEQELEVVDPIILFGKYNPADLVNLGLLEEFTDGVEKKWSGIIRSKDDKTQYLLEGVSPQPNINTDVTVLPRGDLTVKDLNSAQVNTLGLQMGTGEDRYTLPSVRGNDGEVLRLNGNELKFDVAGDVEGPQNAIEDNIPKFEDTSGKSISDSLISINEIYTKQADLNMSNNNISNVNNIDTITVDTQLVDFTRGTDASAFGTQYFTTGDSSQSWFLGQDQGNSNFVLKNNLGERALITDQDGNVGIGGSSPTAKLEVSEDLVNNTDGKMVKLTTLITPTAFNNANYTGIDNQVVFTATPHENTGIVAGMKTTITNNNLAQLNDFIGNDISISHSTNQTISDSAGVRTSLSSLGGGTINRSYGVWVQDNNSSAVITRAYGVKVDRIKRENVGTGYAFFSDAEEDLNYFRGKVGFQEQDEPLEPIHMRTDQGVNVLTGLISITNGSVVVVGSGTLFTTELVEGVYINVAGKSYKVKTVNTDLLLVLETATVGTLIDLPFSKINMPVVRLTSGKVDLVNKELTGEILFEASKGFCGSLKSFVKGTNEDKGGVALSGYDGRFRQGLLVDEDGTVQIGSDTTGYKFPLTRGADTQVLKTDGSGVLSWQDESLPGSDTLNGLSDVNLTALQADDLLQYNLGGNFWFNRPVNTLFGVGGEGQALRSDGLGAVGYTSAGEFSGNFDPSVSQVTLYSDSNFTFFWNGITKQPQFSKTFAGFVDTTISLIKGSTAFPFLNTLSFSADITPAIGAVTYFYNDTGIVDPSWNHVDWSSKTTLSICDEITNIRPSYLLEIFTGNIARSGKFLIRKIYN